MMSIAGSSKVVFSKDQKQAFINQAGNREWTSLIEAICITCRQLLLFVILKGKIEKTIDIPMILNKVLVLH